MNLPDDVVGAHCVHPWNDLIQQLRAHAMRPYFVAKNSHDFRILWISASVILLAILGHATPDSVSYFGFRIPELCPFRFFTGFDCPGCGITRVVS